MPTEKYSNNLSIDVYSFIAKISAEIAAKHNQISSILDANSSFFNRLFKPRNTSLTLQRLKYEIEALRHARLNYLKALENAGMFKQLDKSIQELCIQDEAELRETIPTPPQRSRTTTDQEDVEMQVIKNGTVQAAQSTSLELCKQHNQHR